MMAKVPAPRLATVAPGVSAPFARVIDRGLEFRREDRYATAAAMAKDVRLASQQLEAGAGATRVAKPSGVPPPPLPRATRKRKDPSAPTIELDSDALVLPREPWPQVNESIRIPKNGSVLPWIALLVAAGIGGRLWGEKAWEIARARWTAARSELTVWSMGAAQDAPTASAPSDAPAAGGFAADGPVGGRFAADRPVGGRFAADGGAAVADAQADAATGPTGRGPDRKPGPPASPQRVPAVRHHAGTRTSPAPIRNTKAPPS
jgi:hypothetical protein